MSRIEDHVEIQDYLARFWRSMDQADYPALLAGLTEDCRWFRDRWREGHADILESLNERPALAASRHNIANLILDPMPAGGYVCEYNLIIFGHPKGPDDLPPPYRTPGARMGDWYSELVKDATGWKARVIRAELIFDRPSSSERA